MSHDRGSTKKLAERHTIRDVRGDPIDVWGVRYEKVETLQQRSLYARRPDLRPLTITVEGHELVDNRDGWYIWYDQIKDDPRMSLLSLAVQ